MHLAISNSLSYFSQKYRFLSQNFFEKRRIFTRHDSDLNKVFQNLSREYDTWSDDEFKIYFIRGLNKW